MIGTVCEVPADRKRVQSTMKLVITAVVLLCASISVSAQSGAKACDELKDEIAKKLDAKSVTNYTLTVVDKGKEGDGKVVGGCGGGTKSILYSRGTAAAPSPAAKADAAPKAAPQTDAVKK